MYDVYIFILPWILAPVCMAWPGLTAGCGLPGYLQILGGRVEMKRPCLAMHVRHGDALSDYRAETKVGRWVGG